MLAIGNCQTGTAGGFPVDQQIAIDNVLTIVIIAALIMVLAIGIQYSPAGCIQIGKIALSGLAVAALVGVILNAILPGNDFVMTFDYTSGKETDAPAKE